MEYKALELQINDFFEILSSIKICHSAYGNHVFTVPIEAKVETLEEKIAAYKLYCENGKIIECLGYYDLKGDDFERAFKKVSIDFQAIIDRIWCFIIQNREVEKLLDKYLAVAKTGDIAQNKFVNQPLYPGQVVVSEKEKKASEDYYTFQRLCFMSGVKDRFIELAKEQCENATKPEQIEIKNDSQIFTDDTHTPPVSASELAGKLNISKSTISNTKRQLGAFFKNHCEKQNTKTPRLSYDELWPLARSASIKSKQKDSDQKEFNSVNDIIKLFM